MPALEDYCIFDLSRDNQDDGAEVDMNNLDTTIQDPSWIEAMQEELLEFKLPEVWTLVDLPNGKRAIGTKWVFRNKKDERGIVIRNKARLVAQGYTQEEGIDYDEVFSHIARFEAIRLFLAYASFKDFVVYQMDVKSAFLYGKIEEEVYVCQPPGFEDPDFPDRVYKVEKALRQKGDILLVQVYVDDIIFGSTNKKLCIAFEKLMHEKFQMSSKGELTFFLGLQVQLKKDGIFISQDTYVGEILKKFRFTEVKTASTPTETQKPLLKDEDSEEVDVHMYRSMIGSLMYLTSSRPDIMFAMCACTRYQVNLKVSHLHTIKRIFRYLKDQPKLGLWYQKDSPFDLVAYTDSDYDGANLDRKSTTGEAEYVAASSCCGQVLWIQNQLLDYGYNFMHTKIFIDNNRLHEIEVEIHMVKIHTDKNVADLLTKAFDFGKGATTATGLEAEQDSGNIDKTQSKATLNEPSSSGTSSGLIGLKRYIRGCSSRRVKSSEDEGLGEEDASKQGSIANIDANEDIYLVNVQTNEDMFGVNDLDGDDVIVKSVDVVKTNEETRSVVEEVTTVTIPVTLAELKSAKPKATTITTTPTLTTTTAATKITAISTRPRAKGIIINEQEQAPTPTVSSQQPSQVKVQDKGKGKMVKPEPVKKMSKKELLRLDEELAFKLQAEEEEEGMKGCRERYQQVEEANIAWDGSKRVEEKRNKPPIRAQQRSIMCTYLKNIEGWKPKSLNLKNMEGKKPKYLKNKSFNSIQKMFDRALKRVNTLVNFKTDLVEGSSKRAGDVLEQESLKKQKVDDEKETAELKILMEVIPDEEEVALYAIPLAIKSLSIVDRKIHKEGKKSYYQIIMADGSSKMYLVFSHMLKKFNREDLETLYKLVKAKYGSTRPVEDLDLVLYGDLKTMFEPHVEDNVWKNQSNYRVLDWKLYDSGGI
ncbi:putative ribonuclease H-like domain-containing protein [Tanacetum coccineum]